MSTPDATPGPAPGPSPRPRPPLYRRGPLAALGRFIFRALRLLFVLMLIVIPVPVAALFARVFLPGRRAVATKSLKKE